MPEGDSVFQLAHRMQFLVGTTVTHTSIRVPAFATVSFNGLRCEKVWPYGKNLYMQFGEQILHTHLRMEGRWAVHPTGTRWTNPGYSARVVLRVDKQLPARPQGAKPAVGSGEPVVAGKLPGKVAGKVQNIEVVGHDLGMVTVFGVDQYQEKIAHFGPDVLDPSFDSAEAIRRISAWPNRSIGEALLDQRNLAGVGNEYRAEICFIAGVHPATPVSEVDVAHIVGLTRKLMWANRNSPVRVSTGVRQAGETSYVFGRNNKPCRRCGSMITNAEFGNPVRIIWWCPQCQPLNGA